MLLKLLKEYFRFNRRSRVVILCLLVAVFLTYLTLFILKNMDFVQKDDVNNRALKAQMDSLLMKLHEEEAMAYRLDTFDPNAIDEKGLVEMGFSEKHAKSWIKYRKFNPMYSVEDVSKLYFVDDTLLERLSPYLKFSIRPKSVQHAPWKKKKYSNKTYPTYDHKPTFKGTIDINTSDTADWIKLKGIGSFLAKQIIQYKERLGGFHSLDQLKEVKYLRPETIESLKGQLELKTKKVRTVNLNEAEWREIIRHPYFDKELTNAVCRYRRSYGQIFSLQELYENGLITKSKWEQIKPYCSF